MMFFGGLGFGASDFILAVRRLKPFGPWRPGEPLLWLLGGGGIHEHQLGRERPRTANAHRSVKFAALRHSVVCQSPTGDGSTPRHDFAQRCQWAIVFRTGEARVLDITRADNSIQSIDVTMVQIPLPRDFRGSVYSVTHKNALITRVRTHDGAIGEAVNGEGQAPALSAARKILIEALAPLLIGQDAGHIERCWQTMFAVTHHIGSRSPRDHPRYRMHRQRIMGCARQARRP